MALVDLLDGGDLSSRGVQLAIGCAVIGPPLRAFARAAWRRCVPPERVLIVGSGGVGVRHASKARAVRGYAHGTRGRRRSRILRNIGRSQP